MHHFFFLSLCFSWLGSWIYFIQLQSPFLIQLNFLPLGHSRGMSQIHPCNRLKWKRVEMSWRFSNAWMVRLMRICRSFVKSIKDLLFSNETTICDLENGLVEWFILVVAVSVGSSHLISVLVLLCSPVISIPQLPVAFIPGAKRI